MILYDLLLYSNPQVLQDLFSFQQKWYDTGIERPVDDSPDITLETKPESLKEIDHEMRKAPSKSRSRDV